MRTVLRITLIVMKMFTIPAAAAVIDREPQLRASLRWIAHLPQDESPTALADRSQLRRFDEALRILSVSQA